jgi:hypothetical protein
MQGSGFSCLTTLPLGSFPLIYLRAYLICIKTGIIEQIKSHCFIAEFVSQVHPCSEHRGSCLCVIL